MNWIREHWSEFLGGTMLTLGGGWLVIRALINSPNRPLLAFKLTLTGLVLYYCITNVFPEGSVLGNGMIVAVIKMLLLGGVMVITWRHALIEGLISPLTSLIDGGNEAPDKKPFYSIVNAKRKRGLYQEAIAEVRKQLDRFPNDFEGVMLLAAIQAENLQDLQAADATIQHFCDWPDAPANQMAAAWTTLADWQLQVGKDVDSARVYLQRIIERFPGSELALKAEQRLAHLAESEGHIIASQTRTPIVVPEGVKNLGLRDSSDMIKPKEIEPGQQAAAYVKHLETHPNDAEVREKLAEIYAKDYQRLDLATMELLHLINEPRHAPKQVIVWLNQLATYQAELGSDVETVRSTLQAIVTRFPDMPAADVTRRRLERLNLEFKGKEKAPGVKLGVYEQNIGLKYGSPRKL